MTIALPGAAADQRRTQLLRGVLDLCLLALIAERPRYGFEIVSGLAENGLELVSEGSIYPLLARLQKGGLIDAYRAPSPSGGAPRKYYRLTDEGRAALTAGRTTWQGFAAAVDRTLSDTQSGETDETHDADR
ncbi:PadR family transcriptional regulator [Streptomyces sp. HNM0663]|uniref:PadR family transcriptional regulator n=1 Tax=Streptomyces chengmaiensis TaxID=3040919 RepID=A0ABT6HJY3_9ACTN|nr:PadR family transcriptional regulator [Streptomyces chengmaiensis]MDH2389018.1 PadR family transcriptional regulator [Streptomyces chengmaiensis]